MLAAEGHDMDGGLSSICGISGERVHVGHPRHQWWWEQEMMLNTATPNAAVMSDIDSTLGDSTSVGRKVSDWA